MKWNQMKYKMCNKNDTQFFLFLSVWLVERSACWSQWVTVCVWFDTNVIKFKLMESKMCKHTTRRFGGASKPPDGAKIKQKHLKRQKSAAIHSAQVHEIIYYNYCSEPERKKERIDRTLHRSETADGPYKNSNNARVERSALKTYAHNKSRNHEQKIKRTVKNYVNFFLFHHWISFFSVWRFCWASTLSLSQCDDYPSS